MRTLRLILSDQLNSQHSWFDSVDTNIVYLMAEMRQGTPDIKHHIQKVVASFLSMRNFSSDLKDKQHQVEYFSISDEENTENWDDIIQLTVLKFQIQKFEYQLPDEYRLDQQLKSICRKLNIQTEVFDTEHFYTSRYELRDFFEGKKLHLMESFYRMMRKKHHVLMEGSKPLGNQWNFDRNNRKKYDGQVPVPKEKLFHRDVSEVLLEIKSAGIRTFGNIEEDDFCWPTSRQESIEVLDHFCQCLLRHFGDFEDAMHTDENFLFHSRLSFSMNSKMLGPREVVSVVIKFYRENEKTVSLSQVEGFVRQILGWREYIRGIYWKLMPDYANLNELRNHNKLPDFFWTGNTKMNCLKQAIGQSLNTAYAHHIQRLMVIGNFALLAQVNPDEVDTWYLGVYIDALEWVELPNTRGMSQFADGGIIATKPYVSSGSYINKMSNSCVKCHYSVKEKFGERACPFNSLYWNFLDKKRAFFKNSQRMAMAFSLLDKMTSEELFNIRMKAQEIISNPDSY